MKKCRIIKREYSSQRVVYVIQQRHPLFFWSWVDAYRRMPIAIPNTFLDLSEAVQQLPHFQMKPIKEKVVTDITIVKGATKKKNSSLIK